MNKSNEHINKNASYQCRSLGGHWGHVPPPKCVTWYSTAPLKPNRIMSLNRFSFVRCIMYNYN